MSDFTELEAIESISLLGKHNGVMEDDLYEIIFESEPDNEIPTNKQSTDCAYLSTDTP